MLTEIVPTAESVTDAAIFDLVRRISRGESTIDVGQRVYAAAEEKGLIVWDSRKGYGGGYVVRKG